jgi:hypothetical protein
VWENLISRLYGVKNFNPFFHCLEKMLESKQNLSCCKKITSNQLTKVQQQNNITEVNKL